MARLVTCGGARRRLLNPEDRDVLRVIPHRTHSGNRPQVAVFRPGQILSIEGAEQASDGLIGSWRPETSRTDDIVTNGMSAIS